MKLPNGYGSVHKLPGNRRKPFRARITKEWSYNGKQIYLNIGYFETKKDGLMALAEYHHNPSLFENKYWTLSKLYETWLETKKNEVSSSAIKGYELAYNHCSSLYNVSFCDIKLIHLQEIVNSMGNKMDLKRKFKWLFNMLYDFAIANDICEKKYSAYINVGKGTKSTIHKPFTKEEIDILWDNLYNVPFVDYILIYIYTGFRPSELIELIWDKNVHLDKRYLQGGLKTEAGKNRIVPIHSKILPLLETLYKKENEYILTDKKGKPLTYRSWSYIFHKTLKELGIENLNYSHNPHDTRYTFASLMDGAGANKLCTKKIMGHASGDITDDIYTLKSLDELKEAIELIQ